MAELLRLCRKALTVYAEGVLGRARIAQQLNAEGWRFKNRHNQPRRLVEDDVQRVVANWPEYGGLVGDKRAKDRPACAPEPEELTLHLERAVFPVALLKAVAEVAVTRCQQRPGRGRPSITTAHALAGLCYCAHCEAQARRFADEGRRTRLNRTGSAQCGVYRHPAHATCGIFNAALPAEHLESEVGSLLDVLCPSDEQLSQMNHCRVPAASVQPPLSILETRQVIADYQERLARATVVPVPRPGSGYLPNAHRDVSAGHY